MLRPVFVTVEPLVGVATMVYEENVCEGPVKETEMDVGVLALTAKLAGALGIPIIIKVGLVQLIPSLLFTVNAFALFAPTTTNLLPSHTMSIAPPLALNRVFEPATPVQVIPSLL